jgi:hypothetical protein
MATVNESAVEHSSIPESVPVVTRGRVGRASPGLERELRQAEEDFARGDYIELTPEQLERCIATGESPWPDESSG